MDTDFRELTLNPMFLDEAIAFFKKKGYVISKNIKDLEPFIHAIAFTASRIVKVEALLALQDEINRSIEQGLSYSEFKKTIRNRFSEMGMWGDEVKQIDPDTGEEFTTKVNMSRIQKIFDTNIRVMHAEGQWQRTQDYKDLLPYLVYDANNSGDPRPEHSAWDGLTLLVDDAFWLSHAPVKAYGCKCRTYQTDEIESGAKTTAPKEKYYTHTDKDGKNHKTPEGVDPSFNYPLGSQDKILAEYLKERMGGLKW